MFEDFFFFEKDRFKRGIDSNEKFKHYDNVNKTIKLFANRLFLMENLLWFGKVNVE